VAAWWFVDLPAVILPRLMILLIVLASVNKVKMTNPAPPAPGDKFIHNHWQAKTFETAAI
jgi:hypothetical protein